MTILAKSGKTAMIVAGGTGGHIFPGLAVAQTLKMKGWNVVWLGTLKGMESIIVPQNNIEFHGIEFSGLRGKGILIWFKLPWRLLIALWQTLREIRKSKPDVLVCFGGYVTFPAGIVAYIMRKAFFIHEQNSVAGLSNKILSFFATKSFTAFPHVIKDALWIGNPLRSEFLIIENPEVRYANRQGPLNLLILGGSLGASFLNDLIPNTVVLLTKDKMPNLVHQSGVAHVDKLRKAYQENKIDASVIPFIQNVADEYSNADLVICRSGASTVTEIAAVGVAALFVPLPLAVDDHQTKNAQYLVDLGAAWLEPQKSLTPEGLAQILQGTDRNKLQKMATQSKKLHKSEAVDLICDACEECIA
ncbi:MAG TPA: undecaprenyldiphospho-muramoylpentapeptide beta-N-acetylglucosaminyltransferase [Burkholderiaceae bacterium]|nr:undecaprenyldiphospho-muramoylpentapeptide beta-N-acetylglucosaminyltransferase [Burkholderiaceae bacterium]